MDIESRIRSAYQKLAKRPGDFVPITAIRTLLVGVPAGDLGAMLVRMYRQQAINLVPQSNQRALTATDRAMSVRCGGEDKHLMSID